MAVGRPSLPVGTWGDFTFAQPRKSAWRVRTRIRDLDGVVREVTATGTTRAAAERALRVKLADRSAPRESAIGPSTTVSKLAKTWIQHLRDEGRLESTTINEYQRVLDNVIVPELGGLKLSEVTTGRLDSFILRLRQVSVNRQRKTKVVLGAMFGLAVRHDALVVNPVHQTSKVHRERQEVRTLTVEDLNLVRQALRAWEEEHRPGPRATTDMADIIDVMLGSGSRIGEVLALRWTDLDLDSSPPLVVLNGTIKNEKSKGTYRKATPKTDASVRTVALPEFAAQALRRRRSNAPPSAIDAVFPTRNDTWQQVSNVQRRWRAIRSDFGLDWVTPHTFRKTVATLIAQELNPEVAAQQLGHTSSEITRRFYISKPALAADASELLERLGQSPARPRNTAPTTE